MIKVPATDGGAPAIEELTARGVNVNVTLLFSVERYEQVDRRLPRRPRAPRRAPASLSTRSPRSPRSSSRASTPRSTPSCRPTPTCAGTWRSPTPSAPTHATASVRRRALAGAARRRRPRPAAAVGEHRHQGSGLLRRPLRRGADRPRRGQHDARGHAARVRRPRRRQPRARHRRGPGRRRPPPRRATPASTSPPSPRDSSARAWRSFCDSYHELLGVHRDQARVGGGRTAVAARDLTGGTVHRSAAGYTDLRAHGAIAQLGERLHGSKRSGVRARLAPSTRTGSARPGPDGPTSPSSGTASQLAAVPAGSSARSSCGS